VKHRDRLLVPLIWGVVLIAGLSWLVLPVDHQPRWPVVLAVLASTALVIAVWLLWRRPRPDGPAADIDTEGARELPVVLVVGPHAGAVFARGARSLTLRRDGHAAWLYVKTPDDLARGFDVVERSHGRLPVAALLPLIPESNADDGALRREFSQWRRALDETVARRACVLPCHLAVYASVGAHGEATPGAAWYGDFIDANVSMPSVDHIRQRVQSIRDQLDRASLSASSAASVARAALAQSVLDWLQDVSLLSVLAPLANTAPFELRGLLLADVGRPVDRAGAWSRWLTARTGLQPAAVAPTTEPLPLPAVVSTHAANGSARAGAGRVLPTPRAPVSHVVAAMAVVLALSFAVSGWHNGRLIEQVADELRASRAVPPERFDLRHDMLRILAQRRAAIGRYGRFGEPDALGWGLYRGPVLQSALARTIAAQRAFPQGITLDSIALFDSGQSTLKAGATEQLQGILSLIRLNPDKRVLIAGHTDDVGPAGANQRLSEARARAIRDWFVDTAKLSPTRFAIQGFGDTRPLASNADERGRARNRRVEIMLVPDAKTSDLASPR